MKVFFDVEFTGLQKDTTMISIGLISADGKMFYAELTDYDEKLCDDWIKNNVFPNLLTKQPADLTDYVPNYHIGNKYNIARALTNWFNQFDTVELVADVGHYDMVLLIDLFGHAFKLPNNVAPTYHDVNQDIARCYKISLQEAFDKPRDNILREKDRDEILTRLVQNKHNALYDATITRELYQVLHNVDYNKKYKID